MNKSRFFLRFALPACVGLLMPLAHASAADSVACDPRPWCSGEVSEAIKAAWKRAQNGMVLGEAGFLVQKLESNGRCEYKAGLVPYFGMGGHLEMAKVNSMSAVFHTHPNRTNGDTSAPSEGDIATATRLGVPVYVISNTGLKYYDPAQKQTLRALATNWGKKVDCAPLPNQQISIPSQQVSDPPEAAAPRNEAGD